MPKIEVPYKVVIEDDSYHLKISIGENIVWEIQKGEHGYISVNNRTLAYKNEDIPEPFNEALKVLIGQILEVFADATKEIEQILGVKIDL